MRYSGFSSRKGLVQKLPGLKSAGAVHKPPSYGGMVPSALPAWMRRMAWGAFQVPELPQGGPPQMQNLTDRPGQRIERVEVSLNDLRYWTYMEPACKSCKCIKV